MLILIVSPRRIGSHQMSIGPPSNGIKGSLALRLLSPIDYPASQMISFYSNAGLSEFEWVKLTDFENNRTMAILGYQLSMENNHFASL